MKVYCIRHGFAGDYIKSEDKNAIFNPEDLARVLLPDGLDAVKSLAGWMVDNGEIPSVVLHSPVMRAKQTGKILVREIRSQAGKDAKGLRAVEEPTLEISKPWEMVVKNAARTGMKRVALVAHIDNIIPGLRALNFFSGADKYLVDPIAMAEVRVLNVDRDNFAWTEQQRILPSDLGGTDYY